MTNIRLKMSIPEWIGCKKHYLSFPEEGTEGWLFLFKGKSQKTIKAIKKNHTICQQGKQRNLEMCIPFCLVC